jgi:hypothetical protein
MTRLSIRLGISIYKNFLIRWGMIYSSTTRTLQSYILSNIIIYFYKYYQIFLYVHTILSSKKLKWFLILTNKNNIIISKLYNINRIHKIILYFYLNILLKFRKFWWKFFSKPFHDLHTILQNVIIWIWYYR